MVQLLAATSEALASQHLTRLRQTTNDPAARRYTHSQAREWPPEWSCQVLLRKEPRLAGETRGTSAGAKTPRILVRRQVGLPARESGTQRRAVVRTAIHCGESNRKRDYRIDRSLSLASKRRPEFRLPSHRGADDHGDLGLRTRELLENRRSLRDTRLRKTRSVFFAVMLETTDRSRI